jgi:hypothetical protein
MVDVFSMNMLTYECGTLKPVDAILRKRMWKRENSGEDEPNQDRLYTYMEMSQ